MNWLRSYYDRAAVFLAGGLLLLCALLIWRQTSHFAVRFAEMDRPAAPHPAGPPPGALELKAAAALLHDPAQWSFSGRGGLFVPERHFIGANGFPATLQNAEVHPPVPNEWLEQYSLPIAEADVLEQDADGDGFSNLDEWRNKTDPTKKNSHPDYLTKLKLRSFTREPFRMIFASRTGDTFALNAIDLTAPTQFLKLGDLIAGTRFKIVKFTEKHGINPATGGETDVSELTLEQTDTKERVTLAKEKTAMSPQSVAAFVYTWGGKREFQVRKDQEFSLLPRAEIKYKLVEVQPVRAVIVDTQKPDEPVEIGLLSP
jgi:hypothetical protein